LDCILEIQQIKIELSFILWLSAFRFKQKRLQKVKDADLPLVVRMNSKLFWENVESDNTKKLAT
jgi:hypothetical protein